MIEVVVKSLEEKAYDAYVEDGQSIDAGIFGARALAHHIRLMLHENSGLYGTWRSRKPPFGPCITSTNFADYLTKPHREGMGLKSLAYVDSLLKSALNQEDAFSKEAAEEALLLLRKEIPDWDTLTSNSVPSNPAVSNPVPSNPGVKIPEGLTRREYNSFEKAYRFFDDRLFGGILPDCLIVLHRKANAKGYYAPERYENRETGEKTDELALNPDTFGERTDIEILSTLVHEQVHLWQFHHGNPSRKGYHDREWADKMEFIGLMPSDTGAVGGKRTGQKVTHYIIPGGAFERAAHDLLSSGFKLNWQSPSGEKPEKTKSKVKYFCPICKQNAWAKMSANLVCGDCNIPMVGTE